MSTFDLTLVSEPVRSVRRLEVITAGGRRRWSAADKARIIEETLASGAVVSEVAPAWAHTPVGLQLTDLLHRIGEDVAERLDLVPAQFRVLVVRRPKYACRTCEEGVVQAAAPERLIAGGLPSEALVAQVLVSKYADHLPLYRQAQIYAR